MTNELIEIIDNCNSTLDDIKDDFKLIAERLNIDTKYHYSNHLITDKIQELVMQDLNYSDSKDSIAVSKLGEVRENLIYKLLLFDEPVLEYLDVLETLFTIKNATIRRMPPFENKEKWSRIISNIKDYQIVSKKSYSFSRKNVRDYHAEEYDRVEQLKLLISVGCLITLKNDDLEIKNLEIAIEKVNSLTKEIGGLTLARSIFNLLSQNVYSKQFERYHLTRLGNGLGMHKRPQIPFGYLLNLAVKYPYEKNAKKNFDKELNLIQKLSIAIVTGSYNVQHYNQWTNFFQTGETIINFCTEIALWDSMYSLIQLRPTLAISIVKELFSNFDNALFIDAFSIDKNELFQILDAINDFVKSQHGPVLIYLSKISKILKNIDKDSINNILNILSHKDLPNNNYLLPSDIVNVDFQFNPLIKLGDTKYLLMDKSWCAPAFFESIATAFRLAKVKDFESKLGYELEKLIYKNLILRNIKFTCGDYTVDSIDGECDLLIETSEAIILVEFKKKVLTRKAKSGIDIDLLIDLSDSILSSQIQAGRTEIILREKKEIKLIDRESKNETIIEYKDRTIERVSLTQLDYGGFHDRTIINQFFNALLTHSYGTYSSDKRILKKFEQLKEKQRIWVEQYNKLNEIDERFSHFPFFNCSFLNLGQFIEILNLSKDNDTFYDKLKSNKFVTMGTLDFYKEFELTNKMNENASR